MMELLVEKIVGEEEEKGGGGTVDRKSKIRIRGREEAQKKTLLRPDFECNQTGLANELCLDELIHYEKKRIFMPRRRSVESSATWEAELRRGTTLTRMAWRRNTPTLERKKSAANDIS